EPRVVHSSVGIFKAFAIAALERRAGWMNAKVDRARCRQPPSPADMIVEEEPEPQQPARPQAIAIREDEAHRADDVGGDAPQSLALFQRLAHQRKFIMFQISKA